ncbi:MAG: YibE/F family protein [Actinobacteria bacterium]|nr:YibE/F family protein [Actinomycetota bacterium]
MRELGATRAGRLLIGTALAIAVATAVGLALLWPGEVDPKLGQVFSADSERAEVTGIEEFPCSSIVTDVCANVTIRLESGPDEGTTTTIRNLGADGGPIPPGLDVGDAVRATPFVQTPDSADQPPQYSLTDFERRAPMLWLAVAFAALVVVFGRLRGALSLVGLALSLAVVLVFIVPAILDGSDPLSVAIVGALAVMILTIILAHGLNPKSLAALLGTTASLALVALLAQLFTDVTSLTGLSSEESGTLVFNEIVSQDSLRGLLLAGIVIGALGVLDDVTVSQASTVIALRRANPALGFGRLYREAIEVGRDHVSATVNTLVLAYVGASLPVLLLLTSSDIGLTEGINFEIVAKEVVAMLVGSIGLIAAVPLTTALTALLAVRVEPEDLSAASAVPHAH